MIISFRSDSIFIEAGGRKMVFKWFVRIIDDSVPPRYVLTADSNKNPYIIVLGEWRTIKGEKLPLPPPAYKYSWAFLIRLKEFIVSAMVDLEGFFPLISGAPQNILEVILRTAGRLRSIVGSEGAKTAVFQLEGKNSQSKLTITTCMDRKVEFEGVKDKGFLRTRVRVDGKHIGYIPNSIKTFYLKSLL